MSKINKLAKKLKLTENFVNKIIVKNHELNNLYSKKELRVYDLDLKPKVLKELRIIAKTLKVDVDAVINVLLINYLEQQEFNKKLKQFKGFEK